MFEQLKEVAGEQYNLSHQPGISNAKPKNTTEAWNRGYWKGILEGLRAAERAIKKERDLTRR